MKRIALIAGVALFLGVIAAAIVPMWISTAGMGLSGSGYAAVFLMIVFCFAVGGGLMFLIFYSARNGYDDAAHLGASKRQDDGEQ
jgi:hypothetical protein